MYTKSYINEIWKPVVGYVGLYEVSNFGRVKSLERKCIKWNGVRTVPEKFLKLVKQKSGYLRVELSKNGKKKTVLVHRLVWEAFNGPIPKGMQINHINEDKSDNRLDNLNLMTCKENINWGSHNARMATAKINHPSLSKAVLQYTKDGEFVAEYPSNMEAQRQTGVYNTHISACCQGKYRYKSAGGFIWKYKEGEAS